MATNQENIYEKVEEDHVYDSPYENIDTEPKYENVEHESPAETVYSEIHRISPDYINTKEATQDEERDAAPTGEQEEKVESPMEVVEASITNGDGSRRQSSSSESAGDPCDDQPLSVNDDLLMAYSLPEDTSPEPEEIVDYSLKNVKENTTEETKTASDPNQPDIALFVKVRVARIFWGFIYDMFMTLKRYQK